MTNIVNPIEYENSIIKDNFGFREHPVYGTLKFHNGMDISAPLGTDIKSVSSGTVIYSGTAAGYGNVVVIKNNHDGKSYLYAHMKDVYVSKGQEIKAGEIFATVGNTGVGTGPHLHLEKISEVGTEIISSNNSNTSLGIYSDYSKNAPDQSYRINPTQEILDARNNLSPITSSPSAFETVINFFSSTTTSIYDFFKNFNSEVEEIINTNPYVLAKVGNPNFLIGFNQESSYTVKSGDTLSKIASDNNTSINKILEANPNIENPNLINVGDSIIIPKIVQQHSFNTFNGDKSIQLANSNMIATDAIYVDENGNPTSIYDSLFTTEDSNGNKTTFIRDGIKVKAKDDTFISLSSVIKTIDSAQVATDTFMNHYMHQLTSIFTTGSGLAGLISDVNAGIQRGDAPEQIAKTIALKALVQSAGQQIQNAFLLSDADQQLFNANPSLAIAVDQTTNLAANESGVMSQEGQDALNNFATNHPVYNATYLMAVSMATTLILNANEGWDSKEYAVATAHATAQVVAQIAINEAVKTGWFGAGLGASAAGAGAGASIAYIISAGINDLFSKDHMNSHQWQTTFVSAGVVGAAAYAGSCVAAYLIGASIAGPIGAVVANDNFQSTTRNNNQKIVAI